jgi:hypothetical protein
VGKPGVAGVHYEPAFKPLQTMGRPAVICQCLEPDPGNLAVRDFRGRRETYANGETVNPPAIERAGPETPHLQRGALDFYPNRNDTPAPSPSQMSRGGYRSQRLGLDLPRFGGEISTSFKSCDGNPSCSVQFLCSCPPRSPFLHPGPHV